MRSVLILFLYRFVRPQAQQRIAVLKPDGSARTVDVVSRLQTRQNPGVGDLLADLEKIGVEPDAFVLPRPSDLAAGRDPALARAIALAGGNLSPDEAGRLFK